MAVSIERYREIMREYDKLYYLRIFFGDFRNDLTIEEMNSWVNKVISGCKALKRELHIGDFSKCSSIVFGYMKKILVDRKNPNSSDVLGLVEGVAFKKYIPNLEEDVRNPILEEVRNAIQSVLIGKGLLEKFGFNSISGMADKMAELKLEMASAGDVSVVSRICDIVVDTTRSDSDQEETRRKLYYNDNGLLSDVCLFIVKLGVLYNILFDDGNNILSKYREYRDRSLCDSGDSEHLYIEEIRVKNLDLTVSKNSVEFSPSEKARLEYDNKLGQYETLTSYYIACFYRQYEIEDFLREKGMGFLFDQLFCDSTKLFSEFDVLCMPPEINAYSKYSRDGIALPRINTSAFIDLCKLSYKYLLGDRARIETK